MPVAHHGDEVRPVWPDVDRTDERIVDAERAATEIVGTDAGPDRQVVVDVRFPAHKEDVARRVEHGDRRVRTNQPVGIVQIEYDRDGPGVIVRPGDDLNPGVFHLEPIEIDVGVGGELTGDAQRRGVGFEQVHQHLGQLGGAVPRRQLRSLAHQRASRRHPADVDRRLGEADIGELHGGSRELVDLTQPDL